MLSEWLTILGAIGLWYHQRAYVGYWQVLSTPLLKTAHYPISDIGHSKPWKNLHYCINLVKLNINWWHWDSQTTPILSFVLFADSVCSVILPYRRHWRTTWRILFIANFLLSPSLKWNSLLLCRSISVTINTAPEGNLAMATMALSYHTEFSQVYSSGQPSFLNSLFHGQ